MWPCSFFRWTILLGLMESSEAPQWCGLQDRLLQICSCETFFLRKCYDTNVWQQWRSKIERVAPEVCVLLLFPLRGKGAGNINIRYCVEISLYCLALISAGEMDLKYLASTYFTRLNWSKRLFDGTRIACISWNDPMLVP